MHRRAYSVNTLPLPDYSDEVVICRNHTSVVVSRNSDEDKQRAWLVANEVLSPSIELDGDEEGSEGLDKLLGNNFFKKKNSQLQVWLIFRQFVPRDEAYTLSRSELLEWVGSHYLGTEMGSCHGWTSTEAHKWLSQNGHANDAKDVPDDKIFEIVMKYFNEGNDAMPEFMLWPDARFRAFLRARGGREPKRAKRQRPDLVHMVRVRSKPELVSRGELARQLQGVLQSGADWSEEQLLASLAVLGGTMHRGTGKTMWEASRFTQTTDTRDKLAKAEEGMLKAERNELQK